MRQKIIMTFVTFRNKILFYGKELEEHLLSAVRDSLFNIVTVTVHIWRPSLLTTRHAMVTRGPCNIDLAQDRDQWRAVVTTVMNLRGSIKCWEILEVLSNWTLLNKGSALWS
jgi:hypothetical protein